MICGRFRRGGPGPNKGECRLVLSIAGCPASVADEDIGPPDAKLAEELGCRAHVNAKGDKSVFTAFAKVGKFFWQQ